MRRTLAKRLMDHVTADLITLWSGEDDHRPTLGGGEARSIGLGVAGEGEVD